MNTVHFPEEVIPAHTITRCRDCPDFKEHGSPYQDGNTCTYGVGGGDDDRVTGDGIPNWCPRLEKQETVCHAQTT